MLSVMLKAGLRCIWESIAEAGLDRHFPEARKLLLDSVGVAVRTMIASSGAEHPSAEDPIDSLSYVLANSVTYGEGR